MNTDKVIDKVIVTVGGLAGVATKKLVKVGINIISNYSANAIA